MGKVRHSQSGGHRVENGFALIDNPSPLHSKILLMEYLNYLFPVAYAISMSSDDTELEIHLQVAKNLWTLDSKGIAYSPNPCLSIIHCVGAIVRFCSFG